MEVREFLEEALYLSLKDRLVNALPVDPAEKDAILQNYLKFLNNSVKELTRENGVWGIRSFLASDFIEDPDLKSYYIDLTISTTKDSESIFWVEYLNHFNPIELTYLSISDFFYSANPRNLNSTPEFFTYNLQAERLYIWPKFSDGGKINIFGKFADEFTSLGDEIPFFYSQIFTEFLLYTVANDICVQYNVPFQAAKVHRKDELYVKFKNEPQVDTNNAILRDSYKFVSDTLEDSTRRTIP